MNVKEWNDSYGREVATWHYEPPYDFYDLVSDPDDEADMHDPRAPHYRAVLADGEARLDAVEVGIGLRPDLTGETRHFELLGDHEFLRMERGA